MKKIYYLILPVISTCIVSAQVGINTQNPNPSSMLEIYSTNRGVSFPHVNLQSYDSPNPIQSPKESLLVYNTNTSLAGNEGFYFWNGSKWDYMFNDLNEANLENQMKYYSATSSVGYDFTTSQLYGTGNPSIGDALDTTKWTVITALTKNILIDRSANEVLMNINGMLQANNTASSVGLFAAIGFFIDDKLVDVKPIYLDMEAPCRYRQFLIYGVSKNIPTGNHSVKFAIRNISGPTTTGIHFTYGKPNSNCSTLSDAETSISSTIIINQPYVF